MRIKNILSWSVFVGLATLLVVALFNLQDIADWLKLRNYQPATRVVELADHTTMTDNTRRIFYVNHPQLDEKSEFNSHCSSQEQTIVLGCFVENEGIYLLNVTDKRLQGVVEVTAAHEILHAMYARLNGQERADVDRLTQEFFAGLNNPRIRETIENYRTKDPSVVPNELHSILATEVRELSPALEDYYSKYFADRQKIVDYSDQYEQAFIDIETKAENYDEKLASLKNQIELNKQQIDLGGKSIEEKQKEMDGLIASNRIEEYNRQVPSYNSSINEYNRLVNQTKQLINEYNDLIIERNELTIQQQELYQTLDSNSINEKER